MFFRPEEGRNVAISEASQAEVFWIADWCPGQRCWSWRCASFAILLRLWNWYEASSWSMLPPTHPSLLLPLKNCFTEAAPSWAKKKELFLNGVHAWSIFRNKPRSVTASSACSWTTLIILNSIICGDTSSKETRGLEELWWTAFPILREKSTTVPAHKSGSSSDVRNFRVVCLLSALTEH